MGLRLGLGLGFISFRNSLDGVQILFRWGGWVGGWVGWLEKWGLKLISTSVVVEFEVGVELGNTHFNPGILQTLKQVRYLWVLWGIHCDLLCNVANKRVILLMRICFLMLSIFICQY